MGELTQPCISSNLSGDCPTTGSDSAQDSDVSLTANTGGTWRVSVVEGGETEETRLN